MKKLDHIAVAVRDLEQASAFYRDALGLAEEGTETVPEQKVRVAFFRSHAGASAEPTIELLEPTGPDSPVTKFLESRGPGLHHLAFEVDDLEAHMERLKAKGVAFIDAKPRPGSRGSKVAFIHPKSSAGVLVELCERGR
ncbi:MAG: methylmalonyl-CoA epimerase [Elusimicrobia bacterium]|nr:methylmalonyl-CoA epimerase [Elusimicrobiota bacterium]